MPVSRKFTKVRRQDLENLTKAQEKVLRYGSCLGCESGFQNVDQLRAAWKLHRDTILPEFMEDHPGCRPFGWWLCDHGQERPIPNHHEADPVLEREERSKRFNFLHTSIGIPRNGKLLPWQEPEHEYLRRHNLLTPDELAHPDLECEAL